MENIKDRVRARTKPDPPGTEVAARSNLAQRIQSLEPEWQAALPRGMEATRLIRDAQTCLTLNPRLAQCDANTVLGGLMTCAQLGLRPGVLGHAWLLPFRDKRSGIYRAQLVIGYQGYRELAHRSPQVSNLVGRAVHARDEFDIEYGVNDRLVHKPPRDGLRGEATGFYSVVKYADGGYNFWYMSKDEVIEHRDRYAMARDSKGRVIGPWLDNFEPMAIKTTFRQLAKWMPKTPELAYAIEADEKVRINIDADPDGMLHGEFPQPIDGEIVDEDEDNRDEAEAKAAAEYEEQQQKTG